MLSEAVEDVLVKQNLLAKAGCWMESTKRTQRVGRFLLRMSAVMLLLETTAVS